MALFLSTSVRIPPPPSRRGQVIKNVRKIEQSLADNLKKTADKRASQKKKSSSDQLPNGGRINFDEYNNRRSIGLNTRPPLNVVPAPVIPANKNAKFWQALKKQQNIGKRAKWAVQFPKRVKPTASGGHLVLSNPTQRENEKLINAIKREHRPRKKLRWLKSTTTSTNK